jgi:hypothetical protein
MKKFIMLSSPLCLAIFGAGWFLFWAHDPKVIDQQTLAQIKTGMTELEVDELLGPASETFPITATSPDAVWTVEDSIGKAWLGDNYQVKIIFDQGKVTLKGGSFTPRDTLGTRLTRLVGF